MNKKQLVAAYLFFLTFNVYALPPKLELDNLPIEREAKHYENKEYNTLDKYKQAYLEGKCSSVWMWMHMDEENKRDFIHNLRQTFEEKDNVLIKKPTDYYVKMIDKVVESAPQAASLKLGAIFKTIVIIEYDFDEGIDKDKTAKQWLGEYYEKLKEYRKKMKNEGFPED